MLDFFLADDLSGALDAAAGFHHAGRRVRIVLSPAAWTAEGDDEVIAVTTETRNLPPARAAEIVGRAIAHGHAQGARLVYKKIDSTLRGAVAAEIGALANALPEARILFAPANPRVGRTVRDGVLLVRGVPVAETEFARDPVSPVRESAIRRLLGDVAPDRIVIPDIETEADLVAAVAAMDRTAARWVGVGSGALARPVAASLARKDAKGRAAGREPEEPAPGPCLLVCGSAHPANREQAAALAQERGVAVHELPISHPAAAMRRAVAALRENRGAALLIEGRRGDSGEVVQMIAEVTSAVLAATGARNVFVTGGETAFAICGAMRISALTFCAELEPGLSLSRAGDAAGGIRFAIKPGGFGDARTWIRAWDGLVKP